MTQRAVTFKPRPSPHTSHLTPHTSHLGPGLAWLSRLNVRGDGGVRILDSGEDIAARSENRGDEVEVQPHALALHDEGWGCGRVSV